MTPFEIALSVRNRPDPDEAAEAFVQRTLASERMADFAVALELLIGWEQADEDFVSLLDCLEGRKNRNLPIAELIKQKRQLGYDPKLESLLARRWRCPHCKQFACISSVKIAVGEPGRLFGCVTCGEEGMYPIEPMARLKAHDGGRKRHQTDMTTITTSRAVCPNRISMLFFNNGTRQCRMCSRLRGKKADTKRAPFRKGSGR